MNKSLYIVDFHTHLMSLAGLERICPEERKSLFFRYAVPILEPLAHVTEPIHDQLLRDVAMHYRDAVSRSLYALCGQLFLMEAIRLFKTHGLERLVKSMDRHGIRHSTVYSLEPLTHTQEIIDSLKPYPGRFSVFASVAYRQPNKVEYLHPFIEAGTIRGIKIHPMVGGYIAHELYDETKEIIALAQDYNLPVAIHTGNIPTETIRELPSCLAISDLEPLLKAFPKCRFILNHIGWESWRAAMEMARTYPNVWLETSWQNARVIRRAVDLLGPERIIFGSDFPLFQPWQALREVRRALCEKEFEFVASKNAINLLGLNLSSGAVPRPSLGATAGKARS